MDATILTGLALALAWSLTGLYWRLMLAYGQLEQPTDRGMHRVPVPSGAGAAIVAAALVLWPLWQAPGSGLASGLDMVLLATLAALALVSWLDDRHGLSAGFRLAIHTTAVVLLMVSLGPDQRVLPMLPLGLERVLLGLGWLWFVNLYNFMDGIDGLAGAEGIAVAAGYAVLVAVAGLDTPFASLGLIVAAATAGYLYWNWHPAKVFMGDTGSIALGFLLGWLMLDLALRGLWAAATILPLYFVADASLTLLKRVARGQKPWQPHRQHAYQRAVLGGAPPSAVVLRTAIANAALVALAVGSIHSPILALAGAAGVVTVLLLSLERLARGRA